jgi:hypothetical protein
MRVKILVAVEDLVLNLRKRLKTDKLKIFKARDGLGLCRYCKHCSLQNYTQSVGFHSDEYYTVMCLKVEKRCCVHRDSLISCLDFKYPSIKKQPSYITRLIKCFIHNDWSQLKEKK